MKSFIEFVETKDTGKTKAYNVVSKVSQDVLGEVRWYGPWRRYCFFPGDSMLFDYACLTEINTFLFALMEARKS